VRAGTDAPVIGASAKDRSRAAREPRSRACRTALTPPGPCRSHHIGATRADHAFDVLSGPTP
jgi:hypothetical protein